MLGLIAAVSTVLCLFFWFRDTRRTMRKRASMVKSAQGQLKAVLRDAAHAPDDPGRAAVLSRSRDIYLQAVELYNKEIDKPWVFLPAQLMGFRHIGRDAVTRRMYQ